jgi:hypothetical protein
MGCERETGTCEGVDRGADTELAPLTAALFASPLGVAGGGRRAGCALRARWFTTKGFAAGRRRRGAAVAVPLGVFPAGEALILVGE